MSKRGGSVPEVHRPYYLRGYKRGLKVGMKERDVLVKHLGKECCRLKEELQAARDLYEANHG